MNGFCGLRGDAKDLWRAGEILDNSSYFSLSYQGKYSLYMYACVVMMGISEGWSRVSAAATACKTKCSHVSRQRRQASRRGYQRYATQWW